MDDIVKWKLFNVWLDKETYPQAKLPERKHNTDAGFDLYSAKEYIIEPHKRVIVHTGVYLELSDGWEVQIRPRSGLAAKYGITVLNTPGTIDSSYRNEIMVILHNDSEEIYKVSIGDRIAQAVFKRVPLVYLKEIDTKPSEDTDRGINGFGSTGGK